MSCRMFGNLIELITQSGNTEFLTEFCSIVSKLPLRFSTLKLIFKMAVALCCINLRNIQVLMDILGKFYRILSYIRLSRLCHISLITFLNILKLIVGYTLTIWISLESALRILKIFVECVGRFGVFQIVSFKVKRCLVLYSGSSQRDGFGVCWSGHVRVESGQRSVSSQVTT